jgi:hypothetical protein
MRKEEEKEEETSSDAFVSHRLACHDMAYKDLLMNNIRS